MNKNQSADSYSHAQQKMGKQREDEYNSARYSLKEIETLDNIEEVLIALRRVIRATDLHSKHLAKTTGLTAPQILLLKGIRAKEQVTIGELASDVSLSQATVTAILDRLEKRTLIYRERSEQDKRKVYVALTDDGHEMLHNAPRPLQDHFTRQFGDLHTWEQTMIISSLQRVAQMMDAQHIDASPVLDVGMLDRKHINGDPSLSYDEEDLSSTKTKN